MLEKYPTPFVKWQVPATMLLDLVREVGPERMCLLDDEHCMIYYYELRGGYGRSWWYRDREWVGLRVPYPGSHHL